MYTLRLIIFALLYVAAQQAVEHIVGGQRVGVLLVGAQLCRWGLVDDVLRNQLPVAIDVAGQGVHIGLVHIAQRAERAVGVAVERAVAHGGLALVGGVQDDVPQLVAQRHQQYAACAGLYVLLGHIIGQIAE